MSIWGSGERPFNSASLKLEGKLSLFSAAKQCGCIAHTHNQTREGNKGLVNTKPGPALAGGTGLDHLQSSISSPKNSVTL